MIAAALERGLEVVGELELAWRAIPNRFLAVTGTNGKTTTVELLGHVYRTAGEPVAVAGNVGTPLSSLAGIKLIGTHAPDTHRPGSYAARPVNHRNQLGPAAAWETTR